MFDDVWAHVHEQDVELAAYEVLEDSARVAPRLQSGHIPRRVRKASLDDDDWEVPSSRERKPRGEAKHVVKRRKTSGLKLDHWSDCMDCGKWRKLQRPVVPNRRFVCELVGVTCDAECDCDDACECIN